MHADEHWLNELADIRSVIRSDRAAGLQQLGALRDQLESDPSQKTEAVWLGVARSYSEGSATDQVDAILSELFEHEGSLERASHRSAAWYLRGTVCLSHLDSAGAFDAARHAREAIADEPPSLPRDKQRALITDLEGLSYQISGDLNRSIELQLEARDYWLKTNDSLLIGRNAVNLTNTYERAGDVHAALRAGLAAREALRGSNNLRAQAQLCFNMAIVHYNLGDSSSAREQGLLALQLQKNAAFPGLSTAATVLLAQVCMQENDPVGATEHARIVAREPDNKLPQVVRLNHLASAAECLRFSGHREEAQACFDRAFEGLELDGSSPTLHVALLDQMTLHLDEGRFTEVYADLSRFMSRPQPFGKIEYRVKLYANAARAAEGSGHLADALEHEREHGRLAAELQQRRSEEQLRNSQALHQVSEARAEKRATQEARQELEELVVKRTAELTESNAHLEAEILERKNAEEERERLRENLRRSQRLEALGTLSSGVAHDFNNLLTVFQGVAHMLGEESASQQSVLELAGQLATASDRGTALTRRLLAFAGNSEIISRVVSAQDVFANVHFLLERLIGEDIKLEFKIDAPNASIAVDVAQLDSALMNLAINGRDAMPGGGTLTIRTTEEVIDGSPFLEVLVSDSGCGISPEHQDSVFNPFFTTKPIESGTGLGLSSAQAVIRDMGGVLSLLSSSDSGTTFRIRIPIVVAPLERSETVHSKPQSTAGFRNKSALLVEDDAEVRATIGRMLRHLGFHLREASDGVQALESVEANGCPDLIISDINMPNCSGVELIRELRSQGLQTQILLISGWHGTKPEELQELQVAFMKKPVGLTHLRDKLESML